MKTCVRTASLVMVALASLNVVATAAEKKKVLWIDSYHEGYAWTELIGKGITDTLGDKAELKIFRMDTKRNGSEEYIKAVALKAKALIEEWHPDVVIGSDDAASKYVAKPYYYGADLPFVFCGLNWDCSVYGFPTSNICGMEEVTLIEPLLAQLDKFAKGKKVGFITRDTITGYKEVEGMKKVYKLTVEPVFAKDLDAWKAGFIEIQKNCDVVIIDTHNSLFEGKEAEMEQFILANTTKPTGSGYNFMAQYALVTFAKSGEEQGKFAAESALKILAGAKPTDIGVTQNKTGELYVSMDIAQKLGVNFPLAMVKTAKVAKTTQPVQAKN